MPSITNIKGIKSIDGLKHWAARKAGEYAADNLEKLQALDRNERVQLVRQAPFMRGPDDPAAIGDLVHAWIDGFIKTGVEPRHDDAIEWDKAPRAAREMFARFEDFTASYEPAWEMSEFTVWSNRYGYAGTADWAAYIKNWFVLGDTKTGNRVYEDVRYQLAALANADIILDVDGTERELPKFDRCAVLHLRPRFAELSLVPSEVINSAFDGFLGMKAVFDESMANDGKTFMVAPKITGRKAAA